MFFTIFVSAFSNSSSPEQAKKIKDEVIKNVFPFLIIFGFLTTCGIFIVTVIKDREDKLRYLLNFAGMRPFAYYFGLIITEFMLFLVIVFLLIILSFLLGIDQFTENLP